MTRRIERWTTVAALMFAAGAGWTQSQGQPTTPPATQPQIESREPPAPNRAFTPAVPAPAPTVVGPRGDRGINSRGLGGGSGANGIVGAPATNGAIDRNPAHRRARQAAAARAAASAPRVPEECADGSALLARSPTGDVIDCPRPGSVPKPVQPDRP